MKNIGVIFAIASVTVALILITAWATMQVEVQGEKNARVDSDITLALKSGDAEKVSSYFTKGIRFYTPKGGSSGDIMQATHNLQTFYREHPVSDFTAEKVFSTPHSNLSYVKGTLVTEEKDYRVYATIYKDQIEQLNISDLGE